MVSRTNLNITIYYIACLVVCLVLVFIFWDMQSRLSRKLFCVESRLETQQILNLMRLFSWRIFCGKSLLYRVIHKSVKHFKNSQQIDYITDHGNSYADRERNSPSFSYEKTRANSCPDLPLGCSSSKYGVQ
jgi:hypothetical protein